MLWWAALALAPSLALTPQVGLAQSPALTVTLQNNLPRIRSTGLLADGKFLGLLRSGFPLRLHYRLELWRVRSSWFDQFVREVPWDAVARNDPLADDFVLIRQGGAVHRYATSDELAAALEIPYRDERPVLFRRAARGDDAQRHRSAGAVTLAVGRRRAGRVRRREFRRGVGAWCTARPGPARGIAAAAARSAESYVPN